MLNLEQIKPGVTVKVTKVNAAGNLHRRILALGIIPGSTLKVVKVAPLGDPIEVKLRQSNLVIRKEEAQQIAVEEIAE
jgi:Fe2+ transport system protein FeoA